MTPDIWKRCRPWLLAALQPECGTETTLLADLEMGLAQLWVGEGAAMVTQCVDEAEGRVLHVWLAGGDLAEILRLKPGVEAWGRAHGCLSVTLSGRKGWARVLRHLGFEKVGDELVRRL